MKPDWRPSDSPEDAMQSFWQEKIWIVDKILSKSLVPSQESLCKVVICTHLFSDGLVSKPSPMAPIHLPVSLNTNTQEWARTLSAATTTDQSHDVAAEG